VLRARREQSTSKGERGSTIALMAASMVFMVAMAAIAIDVVVLYVVRSEAQRAADAAALAGAHQFVTSGFTSGLAGQGQVCNGSNTGLAQAAAVSVAAQNNVGGQPGVVNPADIQCDFSKQITMNGIPVVVNPTITVKVTRQNLPTFFSKIWNNRIVNTVTATSTAEAYNESGSPAPTISSCLKPFLLVNQDPGGNGQFVDVNNNGIITHPGRGGFIGETIFLKPAPNPAAPNPGEFDRVVFTNQPTLCPSGCGGTNDTYQQNIQCCNTDSFQCGTTAYTVDTVNMPDPTDTSNGTQCMIHAQNPGGADTIIIDPPPFQFLAGSSNPTHVGQGTPITTSDSLITVPLFNPPLTNSLHFIGFLQLFVQSVQPIAGPPPSVQIQAVIVNVVGCGTAGPGGNAVISGGGVSPIPVRLVQPGGGGN
jgi:Putative Flp pilus-assembly TadE/G-like